jgi:nitrogen fixation protein NifX
MTLTRRLRVVRSTEGGEPMDEPLKIAFASSNSKTVDQHLGSAKSFAIFDVLPERADQVEVNEFGNLAQDGNEDKLEIKMSILEGCTAVYCQAAGPSAIKRLMTIGVQPVKVSEGSVIKDLLADIQQEMKNGPSGWLAKAMEKHKKADPSRFDEMEAEGWDE